MRTATRRLEHQTSGLELRLGPGQARLSMPIPPAPAPYLAPLAPERPLAHPQYLRGLQLAQLTGANTIQNTLELPHPKIL